MSGSWSGILKEADRLVDQCILDIDMEIQCKGTGLDGVR